MTKNRRQGFLDVAKRIKNFDFRVFVSASSDETLGYFSDTKNIGYFQLSETDSSVQIATCNKTPGSAGTAFFLEPSNEGVPLTKLNKDYLEKAFQMYPVYFTKEDRDIMPVIKFFDLDDFLSCSSHPLLKEV